MRFVWDGSKAFANERKHRVSFEEAATAFADPLALFIEDDTNRENARVIGQSRGERLLLVVYVERGTDVLRLISARRATSHERKRYEEER
jgi:uncharacterized DUF497 family protein